MAGPQSGPGEESFDVVVCTPEWLKVVTTDRGPRLGRHMLVVAHWDYQLIRDYLFAAVEAEEAPTWPLLVERLGRIGLWEFEDYRELP